MSFKKKIGLFHVFILTFVLVSCGNNAGGTTNSTVISDSSRIVINSSNWTRHFSFSINLNNVNRNNYTNTIQEQLTFYYQPNFESKTTSYSTNVSASGYVKVKIGYTTDSYKNVEYENYNVNFNHVLYENRGYASTSVVSLYHSLGTSSYSTSSWVINVEAYILNMQGTISLS